MYKLTIEDTYKLHVYKGGEYSLLGSFESAETIKKYNARFLGGVLNPQEIDIAMKFVEDTCHNTVEFGYRGLFTVSYFNEAIEE